MALSSRGRTAAWAAAIVVVLGGVVVAVLSGLAGFAVLGAGREVPSFPSLTAVPDASLHGTVAYYADATGCVRAISASGAVARDVLCLPPQDPEQTQRLGKLVGPQLVWRTDGRLEVTLFRLTDPPGPSFRAGWQKVVDVRSGAVEGTASSEVPTSPNLGTQPVTAPDGRSIVLRSDDDGTVSITLLEAGGPRTVLSARGPGEGTYRLASAFWSPDGSWIAADDGRILVVTPGTPPLVRVLTAESTQGGYGGYPRFAVTSLDLLTPEG